MLLALICSFSLSAQIEFIPNKGQFYDFDGNVHPEILFKLEQPNGNIYFEKDGLFFQFFKVEEKDRSEYSKEELKAYEKGDLGFIGNKVFYYQMDLDLQNTNPNVELIHGLESEKVRNYYLAHCPDGITNVRSTNEITYKGIYNNIDLRFYSVDNKLKYDFILHPGADPKDISFAYNGFDDMTIKDGGIQITNPVTTYSDAAPIAFTANGKDIDVVLNYNAETKSISYSLGIDKVSETIIIDPTMEWGTYFNGATSATWTRPVFDSNDNMYNAGYTSDATFPVLNAGAGQYFDAVKDGSNDLVIVKFNADHSEAWATYYGGEQSDYLAGYTDYGKAIAINDANEIYVAGSVQSGTTTFPTYDPGGSAWYQDQTHIYGETSFILKFDQNGVRQWASMFQHENGASTSSEAIRFNGIESDGTYLYFTGQLYNWNGSGIPLRTLAGAYNNSTYVGAQDPFLGRFDAGLDLNWCTYLNGGNASNQAYSQGVDLHVDGLGNLWFIGRESMGTAGSHVLVNPGGGAYYQSTHGGDQDLLITKFNSSLSIVWSTYYGGDGQDIPSMITTDSNNNPLIVCRSVKSTNWPTTNPGGGAYFSGSLSNAGNQDSGILKFSNAGVATWCTYINGTGSFATMTGIGADANNNIYVSGSTNSSDFPLMNEPGSYYDGTLGGSNDAVFARFTPGGVMEWSTFYGGTGSESLYSGKGAVLNSACGADFVAFGYTSSTDIGFIDPGSGAWYQTSGASSNSYIFYFSGGGGSTSTDPTSVAGPTAVCTGDMLTLSVVGGVLDPNDTYVWYEGGCGGSMIGTGSTISVTPTATTVYYVRAEGPCGETNCASLTVVVNPIPDVDPITSQTVCDGSSTSAVNFTGSVGGTTFSWTNDNTSIGLAASGNGSIASFTATGSSTVETATVSVTPSANGCVGAPASFTITVNPSYLTSESVDVCEGEDYTFPDGTTQTITASTSHTNLLTSMDGCDSTVVTNVNMNTVNKAISSADGITITAIATGALYEWVDCDNNYSTINGENGQSYTPSSNGNYAVIVTENNCSDTSDCYNVNKIGLDENTSIYGVSLYPNPTSGTINLSIENMNSTIELSITDALGKIVYESEIVNSITSLTLTELAEGLYHIHLRSETLEGETIPFVLKK